MINRLSMDDKDMYYNANAKQGNIVSKKKKFIFVQQKSWQRKLLYLYGGEVCILQVYRPTKYSLPLYFVIVPTNCMYMVIASFITENESEEDIIQALDMLKSWNPGWKPRCFMADYVECELNALESSFKDSKTEILICDYHRLQNWTRWLSVKSSRGGLDKEELLGLMKNIAESYTKLEFQENLRNLYDSECYKSYFIVQKWYIKWLNVASSWVKLYRRDKFFIADTTNGMETLNAHIKKMYFQNFDHKKTQTVSELATITVKKFLPLLFTKYCHDNVQSSIKTQDYFLPFLHNCPLQFVEHVMAQWEESQRIMNVLPQNKYGSFKVICPSQSRGDHGSFEIALQNDYGIPSCGCIDWRMTHFPCRHILAGIRTGVFSWKDLPDGYTSSPFMKIDSSSQLNNEENLISGKEEFIPNICKLEEDSDLIQEKYSTIDETEKFRSNLKKLESLSYLINSEENYRMLNANLEQYIEKLSHACPIKGPFVNNSKYWSSARSVRRHADKRKRNEIDEEVKHHMEIICQEDIKEEVEPILAEILEKPKITLRTRLIKKNSKRHLDFT